MTDSQTKRIESKPLRFFSLFGVLFIFCVIGASIWYDRADPLMDNGLTTYTDPIDNHKVYTIQLVNNSNTNIDIKSVTVNGKKKPDYAQLGITYNSSRLVQFMGDQTDPATIFTDLDEAAIHPQLSGEEFRTFFAEKTATTKLTPILYGIAVRYDYEPIKEVTIRYNYLGFTKEKRITRWFE